MSARAGDVLIDSSAWIQLLRRNGDPAVQERVREFMAADRAVWCDVIQLELWRGASSKSDRHDLTALQTELRSLEMSEKVWQFSFDLAAACRPKGLSIPPTDLMIFACAQTHGTEIYHLDRHFVLLNGLSKG